MLLWQIKATRAIFKRDLESAVYAAEATEK